MTRKQRLHEQRLTKALKTDWGKKALTKAIEKAVISSAIQLGQRHALSN